MLPSRRFLQALRARHVFDSASLAQHRLTNITHSFLGKLPFSSTSEGIPTEDVSNKNKHKQQNEDIKQENEASGTNTSDSGADVKDTKPSGVDLKSLLRQKEALLKEKDRMVADAKQQVLSCLAEVENLRGKSRRDSESMKKYAIESFAADLLDMADNLHRTAAILPEASRNETLANDTSRNAKLLKSMLEGVNMTEKQMLKIFNEFGVRKFDPIGDRYDSNHHLIIDEVEDSTREPHTIINVVKSGYLFKEKLLRPAEVGIVKKKSE